MAVSFARDILPLFRAIDIAHMKGPGVLLDSYAYMSDPANAQPMATAGDLEAQVAHRSAAAHAARRPVLVAIANRAVRKMDERRLPAVGGSR